MSSSMLSLLSCVSLRNGNKILYIDGTITCYTWWQYLVWVVTVAWIVLFGFFVGLSTNMLSKGKISRPEFFFGLAFPLLFSAYYATKSIVNLKRQNSHKANLEDKLCDANVVTESVDESTKHSPHNSDPDQLESGKRSCDTDETILSGLSDHKLACLHCDTDQQSLCSHHNDTLLNIAGSSGQKRTKSYSWIDRPEIDASNLHQSLLAADIMGDRVDDKESEVEAEDMNGLSRDIKGDHMSHLTRDNEEILLVLEGPFRKPKSMTSHAYWEAVLILERLLLILLKVIILNPVPRLYLMLLVTISILILHVIVFPFNSLTLNVIQTVSISSLCLLCSMNLFHAYAYTNGMPLDGIFLSSSSLFSVIKTVLLYLLPGCLSVILTLGLICRVLQIIWKFLCFLRKCFCRFCSVTMFRQHHNL